MHTKIIHNYDQDKQRKCTCGCGEHLTEEQRFMQKVTKTEYGCWEWGGAKDKGGYGTFSIKKKKIRAHRWLYERYHGVIDDDLVVDHMCNNPSCVNPEHLQQITSKENVLKGRGPTAVNAKKVRCMHGHLLKGENLYLQKKTGKRYCRTCIKKRSKEYYANKKNRPAKSSAP